MPERHMRIRLGFFVVLALLALTTLVLLFGGSTKVFTTKTKYTIYFTEAPGVAPGTPVRKSGVRIGQVTALDIDDDTGRVKLVIEIDGKHLPRQNEEPAIARGLLSGDTTVDFIPKAGSDGALLARSDPYPANAEVVGVPPLNTNRLLTNAQETVPNAREALQSFTTTVNSFKTVGPKAERALDEFEDFARSAKAILPEIRETNRRLMDFIGGPPTDPPVGPPAPAGRGVRHEIALNAAAGQAKAPADDPASLRSLARDVQDYLKVLKPLTEDVRALVRDNQPEVTRALKNLRELSDRASDLLSKENRDAVTAAVKRIRDAADDLLSNENRQAVDAIIKNVRDGSDDLTKVLKTATAVADRADAALKDLSEAAKTGNVAVRNFNDRVTQVKTILDHVERVTKPLSETGGDTVKSIARAADELANTVAEARRVIALLGKGEGTLGKVVNDPALYNQLVDAAANLNRTLIRAEKVARDLEVFADKVARKPESIGIGGALRPSVGLKESPYAPLPSNVPFPVPPPGTGSRGGLRPLAPAPGGAGELLPSFPVDAPSSAPAPGGGKSGPLQPLPPTRGGEVK